MTTNMDPSEDDDLWKMLDHLRADFSDNEGKEEKKTDHPLDPKDKEKENEQEDDYIGYLADDAYTEKEDPKDVCEKCDHCGSERMIVYEGQHICMECNTIQSRVIDMGAEWRYYGAEDSRDTDPTRCGMPTNDLLPKSSLGSVIGGRRGDHRDMRRIRMYQQWNSMPYWERTLYAVFEKLANNTANHGVPLKILSDAKVLYKRASEKKISRGDNKDGLIASCIYYACQMNKLPRSPKDVARMFRIDVNTLTKGNARFQTLLQINVGSSTPDDYIARFGSNLKMDYHDIQACKLLAKKMNELEIASENSPTSVAAGALYYYCVHHKINYTKKHIADVCDVSEVTITKCFKRLNKYRDAIESVDC